MGKLGIEEFEKWKEVELSTPQKQLKSKTIKRVSEQKI